MAKIEVPQAEGLYDPVHIKKLEKLQDLNISYNTPLPQIVVIGGQYAGKSSVLESLSGFPFPRAPQCGTRYITEVIYRKHDKDSVVASIEPDCNSTFERRASLGAFKANLSPTTRDGMTIPDIFQSASVAMGVCLEVDEARGSTSLYSKDVLQVEVTGPKEEYLKIIDCPGTPSEPVQVVPCAADVEDDPDVLRLEKADPDRRRSIVVLTKPDLAMESAPGKEVVDPVEIILKVIGPKYFVVRNRGENEATSDLARRNYVEHAFFNEDPWNQVHNQLYQPLFGTRSLRLQVQELLMERTEQYFIEVGKELKARLKHKKNGLEFLGETRVNTDRQRTYLGRVAIRFSDIFNRALGPQCAGQLNFSVDLQLRLAAQVQEMSKAFASILFSRGHSYYSEGEEAYQDHEYPEIQGLLSEAFYCSKPHGSGIMDDIRQIYSDYCGGALGVFKNTILPPLFRNQTRKWTKLTLDHVSNVILVIHDFVYSALRRSCPDTHVLQALWEFHKQGFLDCYRRTIKHAELLLHVKCEGDVVVTNNLEFERLLAEYRMERRREAAKPSRGASRHGMGN
ncbi:P-loop containing nucleoside triphosphate hydrolase protein [Daldinia eschscholtzii]|nr:P-loop containing nucleoside triphosphate hydrolase protein [Daldinia eschscholtzii]